eukprot:14386551-Ditylum_brightwellii.AAC.1
MEYDKFIQEGKKYIVFTYRENIKDMNEGSDNKCPDGKYNLNTFKLTCSCVKCMENPKNIGECMFLSMRKWRNEIVREKKDNKYNKYKARELQDKLVKRHLPTTGLKADLIVRLSPLTRPQDTKCSYTCKSSPITPERKK